MAILESREAKDRLEDRSEDLVLAVPVRTVFVPSVIAVLISALESLAEIIAVLVETDVVRVITDAGVLISIRRLVVVSPTVLTIRLTGIEALFVSAVNGTLDHLSAVATRVVIVTVAVIAIIVGQIVVILRLLKAKLVTTDLFPISLLQISLVCESALTLKLAVT
jgi:hypothetical protein